MAYATLNSAPDFFVVGAAKAGTTAVWTWLRDHPQIFLPEVKEPGYFAFAGKSAIPQRGPYDPDYVSKATTEPEAYARLYAAAGARLSGDVSPVYLIDQKAPFRIASARPDARIIILLRDPVARAFSQYRHHLRDGLEPLKSFEAALNAEPKRMQKGWSWGHGYASHGFYAEQVKRFLDAFERDQILFLDYELLQREPEQCWRKLCNHLRIAVRTMPTNERVNETSNLSECSSLPGLTRCIRHPGPIQRFIKKGVPVRFRSALRKRLKPPVHQCQSCRKTHVGFFRTVTWVKGLG